MSDIAMFKTEHKKLMKTWKDRILENAKEFKYFTTDGVVNPEVWFTMSDKRILYILKEAYCKNHCADWDEAAWLGGKHCRETCKKRKNGAADCKACPVKGYSFNRIAEWTYYILNFQNKNQRISEQIIDHIYWLGEKVTGRKKKANLAAYYVRRAELLNRIAIINIKKANGVSSSNNSEIEIIAEDYAELIERQIDLIKPEYVVCCGTWDLLRVSTQKHIKSICEKVIHVNHPNRISVEKGLQQLYSQFH